MTPAMFFILLRQPKSTEDPRHEPFWEFGSFGRTGCHSRNAMNPNPKRRHIGPGNVVAFLQGGCSEIRIVGVTPPLESVDTIRAGQCLEIKWDSSFRPFCFDDAALLIDNAGRSDFKVFRSMFKRGKRSTLVGDASSQFRSRATAVDEAIAANIVKVFSGWYGHRAENYIEAVQAAEGAWRKKAFENDRHLLAARSSAYIKLGEKKRSCKI